MNNIPSNCNIPIQSGEFNFTQRFKVVQCLLGAFCLLLSFSTLYLYIHLEQIKKQNASNQTEILNLTKQIKEDQRQLSANDEENIKSIATIRLESDLKVQSFAYQALMCEDLRKKLNL